ncbi:hypothetical protein IPA_09560 [Ignicoccus pacificus DSM 13166]|uniref:Uncharacterized protein n=1 Tax=Ignicoccus pacificus DSM 13166 TaxID=940294 RepID=A0A977KC59_9CREN|nr:hypothetical protein IPA_09560 [Ignicoccus pacificus DSM 13166]
MYGNFGRYQIGCEMDIIWQLLSLATALGVFTYFLGVLIYSLPIPIKGIKKWAPALISDGLLTIALVSFFTMIIWGMSYAYKMMGINREDYVNEILSIAKNLGTLYLALNYISKVINMLFKFNYENIPLGTIIMGIYYLYSKFYMFTNIFTKPFMDMLLTTLKSGIYAWTFLYIVSRISELLAPFMLASGIVMVGIPFRITKASGAFLIALAMVTYIMGPLVILVLKLIALYDPLFSNLWNSFLGIKSPSFMSNVSYFQAMLYDSKWHPLAYSVLQLCDLKGICGIYPAGPKGEVNTAYMLGGAPWPYTNFTLQILGITINKGIIDMRKMGLEPMTVKNGMKMSFKGIVMPDSGIVLYFPQNCYYEITSGPKFETLSSGQMRFVVSFHVGSACNVTLSTSGLFDPKGMGVYVSSGARNPILLRKEWYGIDVWILKMYVPQGKDVTVAITGEQTTFEPPRIVGYGYLANKLGLQVLEVLGKYKYNEFDILLLPFFITAVPIIHIIIMSMSTYAIASLISGGVKRLSIKLW